MRDLTGHIPTVMVGIPRLGSHVDFWFLSGHYLFVLQAEPHLFQNFVKNGVVYEYVKEVLFMVRTLF